MAPMWTFYENIRGKHVKYKLCTAEVADSEGSTILCTITSNIRTHKTQGTSNGQNEGGTRACTAKSATSILASFTNAAFT